MEPIERKITLVQALAEEHDYRLAKLDRQREKLGQLENDRNRLVNAMNKNEDSLARIKLLQATFETETTDDTAN